MKQSKTLRILEKERIRLEDGFGKLFDIVHTNLLNMMKVEEGKEFSLVQRQKAMPGKMGSYDKRFVKLTKIKVAKSIKKNERFE